jgi:sulfite dehydrogenase
MSRHVTSLERRRLLVGGANLLAASSLGAFARPGWVLAQANPLSDYVAWKNPDNLIVHTPMTIETRRAALAAELVTAEANLFVRNNMPPPSDSIVADRDAWQVSLEGVRNPRTLTVGELKAIARVRLTAVLQCSGNGRAYFLHKTGGTPWQVGAAGNCTWGGVPLREVVASLGGIIDDRRFITSTGGEAIPTNVNSRNLVVERSVPIRALEDALLAWELNGNPIPLAHGGPLRIILPGYTGVNNIKYVKRVAFTADETDADIQVTRYRMSPVGVRGAPNFPTVWEMDVKSWINLPSPDARSVPPGRVVIQGVAFGGAKGVRGVEMSLDGGRTWRPVPLAGEDLGKYAWRQFMVPVRLTRGTWVIASRATDSTGRVQPEARPENSAGYNNNSWRDHALTITIA